MGVTVAPATVGAETGFMRDPVYARVILVDVAYIVYCHHMIA